MSHLLMDGRPVIADNVPCNRRNHVLKSRENIFKPKCNKELKKKLKKYKLRRDGQEDPDIVDVSQTLISTLRIKSPNNQHNINVKKLSESEANRPYNYLTKMVRLKKIETGLESNEVDVHCSIIKKDETTLTAEAEKKQKDAFKLLMDSRNKSIGTNSPGKEKCEEIEAQENLRNQIEKKELKAKRLLSLNRMAQAKGSLKKVQMEEYREETIKRKMEGRAKRLKGMMEAKDIKNGKKGHFKNSIVEEKIESPIRQDTNESKDTLVNMTPILKTFDLFKDLAQPTSAIKNISKEDEEFLQKLSPSIKKKENMLCYFQKMNKKSETLQENVDNVFQDSDQLIKVKFKSRNKVKKKRSKANLSLDKKLADETTTIVKDEPQSCITILNNENQKRKRQEKVDTGNEVVTNTHIHGSVINCNDIRPKRNTKRPVKYNDDFQLTSSDEDLHIFTPKKKRKEKLDNKNNVKKRNDNIEISKHEQLNASDIKLKQVKDMKIRNISEKFLDAKPIQAKPKQILVPKKATKLAPIFVSKPQLNSAALEAKQKFLHSGVPTQLKKNSTQQLTVLGTDDFPIVAHVQNLSNMSTDKVNPFIKLININYTEDVHVKEEIHFFKNLLDFTVIKNSLTPIFNNNVDFVLKNIKMSYPKFPVYRTYHLLRGKSKGEFKDCIYPNLDNSSEIFNNIVDINNANPDKLNWADKYKPTSEKQLIGNFESIKELRKWLVNWTENNAKIKRNNDGSESSEFHQSDTDCNETLKNGNNLLIITGKVGSGKTLSVYAVAAELAIKVIEVNTSAKRTGKIMLQDLQEATQSHKVDRGKSSTECSQQSQETNKGISKLQIMKKRGRKKKVTEDMISSVLKTAKQSTELMVSQESTRTGMSLILIDDADIVFDQDDGFGSAISQLIHTSKRPVILVTSSLTCPHLQKFVRIAKIIKMRPFLPKMLGTWLDIMCLADSYMSSPGLGAEILDWYKGDIRKTINYLQFYVISHKYLYDTDSKETCKSEDNIEVNTDEENSCMTWADNEGWGEKNNVTNQITWKNFVMKNELQLIHPCSLSSFDVWWNLPDLLNYNTKQNDENSVENSNKSDKSRQINDLNTIAETLNTLSITDYWVKSNSVDAVNATSSPWYSSESASVIDTENLTCYNKNNEYLDYIAYEFMTKGLSEARRTLECKNKIEINYPNMTTHRERDRVVSRHRTLTSYLNASASLDRRALALDYWPLCRNICRTETNKTENNSKRNNRFCHYLKSLNVLCKNDYFETLGESLSCNGK